MSVEYPDLADYLAIAQAVTGLEVKTLSQVTNLDLADSALHAPAAGFDDESSTRTSSTRPQYRNGGGPILVCHQCVTGC